LLGGVRPERGRTAANGAGDPALTGRAQGAQAAPALLRWQARTCARSAHTSACHCLPCQISRNAGRANYCVCSLCPFVQSPLLRSRLRMVADASAWGKGGRLSPLPAAATTEGLGPLCLPDQSALLRSTSMLLPDASLWARSGKPSPLKSATSTEEPAGPSFWAPPKVPLALVGRTSLSRPVLDMSSLPARFN